MKKILLAGVMVLAAALPVRAQWGPQTFSTQDIGLYVVGSRDHMLMPLATFNSVPACERFRSSALVRQRLTEAQTTLASQLGAPIHAVCVPETQRYVAVPQCYHPNYPNDRSCP